MSKFFIRRPIVAIVIAIVTVILGVVSMLTLPTAQFPDIAPDILALYRTAVLRERPIRASENRRQGPARIAPLVNHLFEHARIGVLRDERRAQHLQPLSRDLFDN